jgi:hypothetical protein
VRAAGTPAVRRRVAYVELGATAVRLDLGEITVERAGRDAGGTGAASEIDRAEAAFGEAAGSLDCCC